MYPGMKLVQTDRLRLLKAHENGYYDLQFLKAMPPQHRSRCLDLLDRSPAQLRQDLFALCMLDFRQGGYFVEFGAANGEDLSNTWLLERDFGWTGILAEPGRGWHAALRTNRVCTLDTRCVWRSTGETLQFTETPHPEQSAISSYVKTRRRLRGQSYDVPTVSLNDLLSGHGAPEVIDYMSVDTEGSEFGILGAVDFDRWSFRVLTIKHNFAPQRADIYGLLTDKGYRRVFEDVSRFDDWYLGPAL